MIQRIQSVLLLLAFLLASSLFFTTFADLLSKDAYGLTLKGFVSTVQAKPDGIQHSLLLTLLGSLTSLLIFVTIFLYNKRKIQMNICWLTIILLVGENVAMYLITEKYKNLLMVEASYKIGFVFPLVAAVLVFLAFVNIRKDERLVKSLDRLR
jgi:hypothetical protein